MQKLLVSINTNKGQAQKKISITCSFFYPAIVWIFFYISTVYIFINMISKEDLKRLVDLRIQATAETPEVVCSKSTGKISMVGNLIPSDPQSFFAPINRWFLLYSTEFDPKQITVDLYLTFINGCSEHHLVSFLKKVEELYSRGVEVRINCHYESDDYDMRDWGRDLRQVLKIPVDMVEIN